jgi:hypothetical protein
MILTNCTNTQRGITLKDGIKFLDPREIWTVPVEKKNEIRAMFNSRTFQRFVDNDIFRLSEILDGEESTEVKTPEPPADLKTAAPVEGLQTPVGTATGKLASEPKVVEHQNGGPLTEQNAEVKTPEPPAQAAPAAQVAPAAKAATKAEPKTAAKA